MTEKILQFDVLERFAGDNFISTIAWDPAAGRKVYVKQPRQHLTANEACAKNFMEVARRIAKSQSPHVVALQEVITPPNPENSYYLVLEYVEESLESRLKRGRIDSDLARKILHDVLLGLWVIHGAGFHHANICPASILIGADNTAKLTDFRATWARTDEGTLELGAGRYSPHETLQAGGDTGPWSDLYSLGYVIYEALIGAAEYSSAINLCDKLAPKDPAARGAEFRKWHCDLALKAMSVHIRVPKIDRSLSDVLAKLMEKDISKRFRSAADALAALEQTTESSPRIIPTAPAKSSSGTVRTSRKKLHASQGYDSWTRGDGMMLVGLLFAGIALMSLIVYLA